MLAALTGQSAALLVWALAVLTFGFKAFAFIDAVLRPKTAYLAAGKLDKLKWSAITGVAFVVNLIIFNPLSILNVIGVVAALVYLLDVRPALRALGDGGAIFKRKGRGGPSGTWDRGGW